MAQSTVDQAGMTVTFEYLRNLSLALTQAKQELLNLMSLNYQIRLAEQQLNEENITPLKAKQDQISHMRDSVSKLINSIHQKTNNVIRDISFPFYRLQEIEDFMRLFIWYEQVYANALEIKSMQLHDFLIALSTAYNIWVIDTLKERMLHINSKGRVTAKFYLGRKERKNIVVDKSSEKQLTELGLGVSLCQIKYSLERLRRGYGKLPTKLEKGMSSGNVARLFI